MAKPYRWSDLLSSLGHGAVTAGIATLIFLPLHFISDVANASVIAVLFPMGLYYGREILDQQRNIYEELLLSTPIPDHDKARASSHSIEHAFFVGWDLDGIMDVAVPWIVGIGLAVGGYFV